MAESVARVKILAQIEGLEGFDKLKGAFKGLQQAIGPADADLSKARKEILEFGKAGAKTEQVIRGQVDALKALQGQASIGSTVYRQLGKDIKDLGGAYKEAATGVKQFTDAALKSQKPGAKTSTFGPQIQAIKEDLAELSVYSQAYADKLTLIKRRELPFNLAQGRQGVIAAAEAYRLGPDLANAATKMPQLPDTTAGLNQRLSELNTEFVNLARGGDRWIQVSREIANVQRQLNQEFANPAVEAARRRLEASRNTSSDFLQFSTGLEDRIAIQGSIERNQRKREREAARRSGAPADQPFAPSELFQGIAGISNQTAANQVQMMGRSYNEVAASIREATKASDGSINSLRAQRNSWEALRNTLGQDKAALREVSKELATIDRQLEKRGVGSGGGRIGKGFQAFGAIASGAIFGGPEGAIGGLFGAAIGGVPGAFAGAATGGAIGQARQQVGQFATYAADISKLEIALKGVTKTQDEYQRALAASASVTKDFNVPQLEATRGMTQLSAAVIGAGGKVADAEVVFRNVTAAIKASGGTSEDVQGALTALGQIFSKGKVSAEELQGQLGERLPGAVTMFAKATGRTLPQLQKDLEQGVVGLADLMKFVVSDQGLGQFEQRAKAVAASSAEAGARLTTTWNDTKRAIGEALLPLGAQIQDSLAKALRDATPALVGFAQGMAGFIKLLVDNSAVIGTVLKTLLGFGAVAGAAAGVIQLSNAIKSLTLLTTGVTGLSGAFGVAKASAQSLAITIAAIPGIGWVAAGITALGLLSVELYNNNNTFKKWVDNIGSVIATDFANFMSNLGDKAQKAIDYIKGLLPELETQSKTTAGNVDSSFNNAFKSVAEGASSWFAATRDAMVRWWDGLPAPLRNILANQFAGTGAGLLSGIGNYVVGASQRATQPTVADMGRYAPGTDQSRFGPSSSASALTDWQIQQDQKDAKAKQAADKAALEAERLAAEQQRLDELLARNAIQLDDERFRHRQELMRKEFEYQQELAQRQNALWASNFVGLGAQSARAIADLFGKLDGYRKAQFDAQSGITSAQQGLRSAQALEQVTSQGLTGGGGLGRLSSQGQALVAAARTLGVSPLDLATIIGLETGGTYSPSKRGGAGNNYMGLIQFGPNEQKAYGASPNQSFEQQVTGPVVRYFQDRFKGQGMSTQGADLLTLYRTVLGGNPKASLTGRDAFGTSPQSGVARMAPHRSEALRRFFGGDVANIPSMAAGVAGQVRRDVSAEGQIAVSQAQLLQHQKLADFEKKRIDALKSFDFAEFNQQLTRGLVEQNMALGDGIADLQIKNQLEAEGMRPELIEAEVKKNQLLRDQQRLLEPLKEAQGIADLDLSIKERIAETIANINGLYAEQISLIERQAQAQTASGVALGAYIGQLRQELEQLTNFENVIINVSRTMQTEISGAISSAVTGLVTGSQTIKQTLSQMFSNIGQAFVQMAAEIISKQLVMITLQTILKALGLGMPGGGGAGGLEAYTPSGNAAFMSRTGALGFAKGGVVSRPTFFKFANGGQMQNGVMGEAGPEAIVPLKRGFDGKLGIAQVPAAQGGDTRMRDMMGRSPVQQQAPTLNMTFQTTNIGGVEYVSRDQLEAAMAETRRAASRDGAKRGMSMTLDRLQHSPSTRDRVGIR